MFSFSENFVIYLIWHYQKKNQLFSRKKTTSLPPPPPFPKPEQNHNFRHVASFQTDTKEVIWLVDFSLAENKFSFRWGVTCQKTQSVNVVTLNESTTDNIFKSI